MIHQQIKLLIVYNHQVSSLFTSFQTDIKLIKQVHYGYDAIQLCHEIQPDVILIDLSLPDISGTETARVIHAFYPHIQIIGFSSITDKDMITSFLHMGAKGYVLDYTALEDLAQIIRTTHAGKAVFSPEITQVLFA